MTVATAHTSAVTPEIRQEREARLRQIHTQRIPALRAAGLAMVLLAIVVHNRFLLGGVDWSAWLIFALLTLAYLAGSWLALRRWYSPDARIDLSLLVLALDLIPMAVTVYLTGANRSWIFWIFLFRVVDQVHVRFRRALGFSALGALAYLAVVGYVAGVEGRPVAWPGELAKLLFLLLGGMYMSLTARTVERVRGRLSEAMRTTRRSLDELSEKSRELEHARAQAEAASRAKSEFLSRVSHELRTPMNGILGFAQLLELERLTADQRASVQEILDNGRHLLDIINEVLDIARVETGSLARELTPVHVQSAVDEVLERARPAALERGVQLAASAPDDADIWVMANARKLRQVIANLISNAIKYNERGGRVHLAFETEGDRVRVSVSDTGRGIPAELVEEAFSPFERLGVDASEIPGTGLGLAVARSLVEAMAGRLGVETEVGAGSTFWFELARTDPPAEEPVIAEAVPTDARTGPLVLYIDDKPENATLVARILGRRPKLRLVTAALGMDGLEMAHELRPDLILLDLELPDISGREVLARLRESPETRQIPVVVVSAEAAPSQVERLLADGARAYITMPYDVIAFLDAVNEALALS